MAANPTDHHPRRVLGNERILLVYSSATLHTPRM